MQLPNNIHFSLAKPSAPTPAPFPGANKQPSKANGPLTLRSTVALLFQAYSDIPSTIRNLVIEDAAHSYQSNLLKQRQDLGSLAINSFDDILLSIKNKVEKAFNSYSDSGLLNSLQEDKNNFATKALANIVADTTKGTASIDFNSIIGSATPQEMNGYADNPIFALTFLSKKRLCKSNPLIAAHCDETLKSSTGDSTSLIINLLLALRDRQANPKLTSRLFESWNEKNPLRKLLNDGPDGYNSFLLTRLTRLYVSLPGYQHIPTFDSFLKNAPPKQIGARFVIDYAASIAKQRTPGTDLAIADSASRSSTWAYTYTDETGGERFPPGEAHLIEGYLGYGASNDGLKMGVTKYARYTMNGCWPEAEAAIINKLDDHLKKAISTNNTNPYDVNVAGQLTLNYWALGMNKPRWPALDELLITYADSPKLTGASDLVCHYLDEHYLSLEDGQDDKLKDLYSSYPFAFDSKAETHIRNATKPLPAPALARKLLTSMVLNERADFMVESVNAWMTHNKGPIPWGVEHVLSNAIHNIATKNRNAGNLSKQLCQAISQLKNRSVLIEKEFLYAELISSRIDIIGQNMIRDQMNEYSTKFNVLIDADRMERPQIERLIHDLYSFEQKFKISRVFANKEGLDIDLHSANQRLQEISDTYAPGVFNYIENDPLQTVNTVKIKSAMNNAF